MKPTSPSPSAVLPMKTDLLSPRWILALLLGLSLMLYLPALHHGVVLDDRDYLMNNPLLKRAENFLYPLHFQTFARSAQSHGIDPDFTLNFILRPVTYASFFVNRWFGGTDPAGYRLVNLTLHACNGWLIWLICRRLTQGESGAKASRGWGALAAALLFTAHPLATESVTYVVQRFESLATLFYLAAVAAFLRGQERRGLPWRRCLRASVPLLVLASMLSKEIGFTLPLILVLLARLHLGQSWLQALRRCLPSLLLLPVLPALLVLTSWAQKGDGSLWAVMNITNIGIDSFHPLDYAMTQVWVCWRYLRLLLVPVGQNFDPELPLLTSAADPRFVLSMLGILALLAMAWRAYHRRTEHPGSLLGLGVLWFFITLAPSSSFVPLPDLMAEHRCYLPSVGLCLALAGGLERLSQVGGHSGRRFLRLVLALWVVTLAAATLCRNEVLRDDESIYRDVIAKTPDRARAWNGLAVALDEKGRSQEAIACLRRAVALKPRYGLARENLAILLLQQGQCAETLKHCQDCVREGQVSIRLGYCQAVALHGLGRTEEAIHTLLQTVQVSPYYREAQLALGYFFAKSGRDPQARHHYTVAQSIAPLPDMHRAVWMELQQRPAQLADHATMDSADSLTRSILQGRRW